MWLISEIRSLFSRVVLVSASNASRAGVRKVTPDFDGVDAALPPVEIAERMEASQTSIRRVLEAMDADGGALLKADLHLSLYRLFSLLNDGATRVDAKDIVACIQRLAALQKAGEGDDAQSLPGGVPDEVLDAITGEPGVAGA